MPRKVYWRWKKDGRAWIEGWPIYLNGNMYRMGHYNGDFHGTIVDKTEIEWREA